MTEESRQAGASVVQLAPPLSLVAEVAGSRELARAILEKLKQAGYAFVSVEPSDQMIEDGWAAANEENARGTWLAMMESELSRQALETQDP